MRCLGRWWWAVLLPMAVLVVAGSYDRRWLVVAFGAMCVLLPGLLLLAYYHYALSPEAVRAIMPQRATLTDNALIVRYYPVDYADARPSGWVPEPRTILRRDVVRCSDMGTYTTIELRGNEMIEIPCAALPKGMNLCEFFAQTV